MLELATGEQKASHGTPGSRRFLLFVGGVGLLAACLGLGLIFITASYDHVQALSQIEYHEAGFVRLALALTPARYQGLRMLLAFGVVVGLGLLGASLRGEQPLAHFRAELRQGRTRLAHWWQRLPRSARATGVGLVVGLAAVRLYYGLYYPLGTDEVASYDYFVHHGPLAISSFYPIPNNHIFYNFLAWPLAAAGGSPRLVMRLPTLLLGTVGMAGSYVLLARIVGLRMATLVTGLVGLAPIWVYYGAVGRGYFVQFYLLQLGVFAVLELGRPFSPYRRVSWAAFIGSSVLGLYTVPTYAYPLAGLVLGLAAGARRQGWPELVLAGGIVVGMCGLLYAPVVAVSGLHQLLHNPYVVAKTPAVFWASFRAVLYETATELFGPPRYSGLLWLALAGLGGVAIRRWARSGAQRDFGTLAWAMMALPLLFMVIQRVYPPTRTLLFVGYFGPLLSMLLLSQLPWRRWLPVSALWPLIGLAILLTGGLRLYKNQAQVRASRHETQLFQQAYGWLRKHALRPLVPARVWMNAPLHELFFAHYLQQEHDSIPRLALRTGSAATSTQPFDFLVLNRRLATQTKAPAPAPPYHQVYRDELVIIYAFSR
ncbi:MAG TPA: hypothetical protein VF690_06150 [Hymenobacter sp.]